MFSTNKALIAGGGATFSTPVSNALGWLMVTYLGMPHEVADPIAMLLAGLIVGMTAYLVPNAGKQ